MAWTTLVKGTDGWIAIADEAATPTGTRTLTWPTSDALVTELFGGPPPVVPSLDLAGVRLEVTTSGTAGNRLFRIQLQRADGNILYDGEVAPNIPASQTLLPIEFVVGFTFGGTGTEQIAAGRVVKTGLGIGLRLVNGMKLVAFDGANIDAAADIIRMHVRGKLVL